AWPEVRFNSDLKDEPGIALLADALRRTGAWDRVCVTSFSGSRLRAARGLLDRPVCMATSPAVIAAVGCSIGSSRRRPGLLADRLAQTSVRCVQIPGLVTGRRLIRRAHALG